MASPDADVFICLSHHFSSKWKQCGLEELWVLCGQGSYSRAVPLHKLLLQIPCELVAVLPAAHALSGCDTTSKVATKHAVLKVAEQYGADLLVDFGTKDFSPEMEVNAEKFLVHALGSKANICDELRHYQYHHKNVKINFEMLAHTSEAIKQHIKRSYLQCYHWLHASDHPVITLDPMNYGYTLEENGILAPSISSLPACPADFPLPCKCAKCQRSNVCPCRQADIRCCSFCKCEASAVCDNPNIIKNDL